MSGRRSRVRELILYATPTGRLGRACARYFAEAEAIGPTTAQTYPPHCTLTGFFRRRGAGAERAVTEIVEVVNDLGPVPLDSVEVVGLTTRPDWIGLELRSPWLIEATSAVVDAHRPGPDEDALRPKEWLHLSLAYDVDDLDPYARLAVRSIDPTTPAGWELALWERLHDGQWLRH